MIIIVVHFSMDRLLGVFDKYFCLLILGNKALGFEICTHRWMLHSLAVPSVEYGKLSIIMKLHYYIETYNVVTFLLTTSYYLDIPPSQMVIVSVIEFTELHP